MNKQQYGAIEAYMRQCMSDAVHDRLHISRVVHYAAQIADRIPQANFDVVIAAALLHDIGRPAENRDPSKCHAEVGGRQAYAFLICQGYAPAFAAHVRDCILTHRHRKGNPPATIEAQIIYDADKLDLIGNIGAARAILFGGQIGEPLYLLDSFGRPTPGAPAEDPSLFREYRRKLHALSEKLHTPQAREIAHLQQTEMNRYFDSMITEVERNHAAGNRLLERYIKD